MNLFLSLKLGRITRIFSLLIITLISFNTLVSANNFFSSSAIQERANVLSEVRKKLSTQSVPDQEAIQKRNVQIQMLDRQLDIADSFSALVKRVEQLNVRDPRKTKANDLIKEAESKIFTLNNQTFLSLDVESNSSLIGQDPIEPSSLFNQKEKEATEALNVVNRTLVTPLRPGTTQEGGKEVGGVPEGDIIDDFIPGIIRLLFRMVTLMILVSFLISGVMFITSFGNDETLNKAKRITYYSLIGFAFVALAFAIVQAITDIDFFGFS